MNLSVSWFAHSEIPPQNKSNPQAVSVSNSIMNPPMCGWHMHIKRMKLLEKHFQIFC